MASPPTFDDSTFDHRVIESGNVRLHCKSAGAEGAPLVVFLHGFPARWSTWRSLLPIFARAGFLAVAPDLRGYGASDKPQGVEEYGGAKLAGDVAAIIAAYGRERAFVVGHDFGGGIAWATAMLHPERVERLAICNSIHPVGFERQMRKWSQRKKSWYIFFFLLPRIPEWWLARHDYRYVRRALAHDGLAPAVVDDLVQGIRAPGALHAAIDWYRASFRGAMKKSLAVKKVDQPTLVVWGDRERHLDPELATPPADWVTNARVEHVPEGSHWVHHDAPDRVAELAVAHFRA
jgi:pimeloyl-ACP methyl ester carboxylesterase